MVRVHAWGAVALATLCHASLQGEGVDPPQSTTIATTLATSDSPPVWLVLPLLLDVQPALLKLNVKRPMPSQLQSFCREHGMQVERCAGAIRQALDQVANFQQFCKQPTAESTLPGFVVARNVLRGGAGSATASWMQNDAQNIALDLCNFVQQLGENLDFDVTVSALENALSRSFEWLIALTPCERQFEKHNEVVKPKFETSTVSERLITIEQMIAALKRSRADGSGSNSFHSEQDLATGTSLDHSADIASVVEIREVEEAFLDLVGNATAKAEGETFPVSTTSSVDVAANPATEKTSALAEGSEEVYITSTDIPPGELVDGSTGDEASAEKQEAKQTFEELSATDFVATKDWSFSAGTHDINSSSRKDENEVGGAENTSCEAKYTATLEEELMGIAEELRSETLWGITAALMLTLLTVYLGVDLLLTALHYIARIPKHLTGRILHGVSMAMMGYLPSTLTNDLIFNIKSSNEEIVELAEHASNEAEQLIDAPNRELDNLGTLESKEAGAISKTSSPFNYFVQIPMQLNVAILQAISLVMWGYLPNTLTKDLIPDVESDIAEVIGLAEFEPTERESVDSESIEPSNAVWSEVEQMDVISEIPSLVNEAHQDSEQLQHVERAVTGLDELVNMNPQVHINAVGQSELQVENRVVEANASSITSQASHSTETPQLSTLQGAVDSPEQEVQEVLTPEPVLVNGAIRFNEPSIKSVPAHVDTEAAQVARQFGANTSLLRRISSHPLPSKTSFTCLAMVLMAGSHGPVFCTRNSFLQTTVPRSSEVICTIRKKILREHIAVRRIQRAWKAAPHSHIIEEETATRVNVSSLLEEVLRSKITSPASTFHLLPLRAKEMSKGPERELGFSHLIHSAMQHRAFSAA